MTRWHKSRSEHHIKRQPKTLEELALTCSNHHLACDCQEYRNKRVRDALDEIAKLCLASATHTMCPTCRAVVDIASKVLEG